VVATDWAVPFCQLKETDVTAPENSEASITESEYNAFVFINLLDP
jgi:hypothetical protein